MLNLSFAAQAIVFANSVDTTTRLAGLLRHWAARRGWAGGADAVAALSSGSSAKKRDAVLADVRGAGDSGFRVLVASDALARGVDLARVALVVNYDAPRDASNYVHRVGRAARAGSAGEAVTLVKRGQERDFARMRATIAPHRPVAARKPTGLKLLVDDYKACLEDLRGDVEGRRRPRRRDVPAAVADVPPATGGDATMADAPPARDHRAKVRAIFEQVGLRPGAEPGDAPLGAVPRPR